MSKTKSKQETSSVSCDLDLQLNDVRNAVKSYSLSKKYVNRLVKITVLNVLYHRIEIPRNEFETRSFDNVPYVSFIKNSKNSFIRIFTAVATGIIDAIEKDYLRQINMYIVKKNTHQPLETYTVKVKYNKDESAAPTRKSAEFKTITKEYLAGLNQLPGKQWKEDEVDFFIELLYNEDTPNEYEPPNFKSANQPFGLMSTNYFAIGKVDTGFHKVTTHGTGKNFVESRASTPTASIFNTQDYMDAEVIEIEDDEATQGNSSLKNTNKSKNLEDTAVSGELIWGELALTDEENVESRSCPCANVLPDWYKEIRCTKCYNAVHITCHGYFDLESVDKNSFICLACASNNLPLNENVRLLMRLRTTVYGIHHERSLSTNLMCLSKKDISAILVKLQELNILKSSEPSDIDFDQLLKAIEKLFTGVNSQYLE